MKKPTATILFVIGSLMFAAEPNLTHKCADFVSTSTGEEQFNHALDRHRQLRKALDGGVAKLDPQKVLPIWSDANQIAFGYDFDSTLVIFCWFTPKAKAGVFYFEGYSALEAQAFVKGFAFEFQNTTPLKEVFMHDGLVSYERLFEAFPRLRNSISPQGNGTKHQN
jgi:hypothetical protein